jgi:hypothetical protein
MADEKFQRSALFLLSRSSLWRVALQRSGEWNGSTEYEELT